MNEFPHFWQHKVYSTLRSNNLGAGNGLSPIRRQAITWANGDNWTLIKTLQWSMKQMSSAKHRSFCSGFIKVKNVLLTHWGQVTHICVSKLTVIGSDNGLSPDRRQAIIWINSGILLIGPSGTNFGEISIEIFSFKKYAFQNVFPFSSASMCWAGEIMKCS